MSDQRQRRDLGKQLDAAIVELKKLNQENKKLRDQLYVDELTDIANRRLFNDKYPGLVELARHNNEPLALLVADADGLKRTNDSLGHARGDELLAAIAGALRAAARQTDLVGRLGGDEFYVLLPGFWPLPGQTLDELIEQTIQRYKAAFKNYIDALNLPSELYINVSFGIAALDKNESAEAFYERVDKIAQYNKKVFYEKVRKRGVSFSDERL